MILQDIQAHSRASLTELALHFRTEESALRPMLALLVRKGRIHRLEGQKCGGCSRCGSTSQEFYEC
jgi:DNA-binding IclR family transcriptional regulator